jgi:hypothetical protein
MRIDSAEDYFQAGLQRMSQAWNLYNEVEGGSYALAMYVSGVAVEMSFARVQEATRRDIRRET